jgi:predicted Zn-dependent protease
VNQRPPHKPPAPSAPVAPAPAKPTLGAKPLPAGRFQPPPRFNDAPTAPANVAPPTREQLAAVAAGKTTWAELMGMTKAEAFGIAQGAYRLFEHGHREKGRAVLEGLIVANPKVAAFHALLGGMQGRLGDEAAAKQSYDVAIKLEPGNLAARVNRAELLLKQGVLDAALEDLLAATKADPQQKTALGKRAFLLARTASAGLKELIARSTSRKPAPPPARR